MRKCLLDMDQAVGKVARRQGGIEGFNGVEGLGLAQSAQVNTAKDLALELRQTGDRAIEPRSPEALSVPVEAEVANDRPEPGGEGDMPPPPVTSKLIISTRHRVYINLLNF